MFVSYFAAIVNLYFAIATILEGKAKPYRALS